MFSENVTKELLRDQNLLNSWMSPDEMKQVEANRKIPEGMYTRSRATNAPFTEDVEKAITNMTLKGCLDKNKRVQADSQRYQHFPNLMTNFDIVSLIFCENFASNIFYM